MLGFGGVPAAVLLRNPQSDALFERFRPSVETEDDDLYALLPEDLALKAAEMGCGRLLDLFEDTLSNTVTVTDRRGVLVRNYDAALDRLYQEQVLGVRPARAVEPGWIPLYSLRAAAGRFGEDMEVEPEDRVPPPAGVKPAADLFAVHVVGHSMEPDVPDGSVAVFRYAPAGSRQGKRVLVWRRGASAEGGEFTLKVYESEKAAGEDGWRHTRIRLKPLNPAFPVLDLEDDSEYRVLGELVALAAIDD